MKAPDKPQEIISNDECEEWQDERKSKYRCVQYNIIYLI